MKNYYKGDSHEDYENEYEKHQGWLVGEFMEGVRKTDKVEIKFWKFKKGEVVSGHPKIQRVAIECILIIEGIIKGKLDGEEVVLKAGDYLVVLPGVNNDISSVVEDVKGLTIKAPSIPNDKMIQ